MVQPAQDRLRNYVSKPLDWPCARRVLPKRNMRYNSLHISQKCAEVLGELWAKVGDGMKG